MAGASLPILCLDVGYRAGAALVGAVGLRVWSDEAPAFEAVIRSEHAAAEYVPGSFYLRELPYLVAALVRLPTPAIVVIDGYVWLGAGRKGLGAHLHEALGSRSAVVGVAKNPFRGADDAVAVLRGGSRRPLFVTAAGLDVAVAAAGVRAMHGAHRLPRALRRADLLSRGLGSA